MIGTRTLLALLVINTLALAAAGQSTAEFGRASGGTIEAIAKAPRQISGSLGLTHSTGAFRGTGYNATLGGHLVEDRLWFFGAASVHPGMQFTTPDFRATAPRQGEGLEAASFLSLRAPSGRTTFNFSFSQQK